MWLRVAPDLMFLELACRGVAEPPPDNPCSRGIRVNGRRARSQDVDHLKLEPAKHISNQTTMTAPPERLGTQNCRSQPGGQVYESGQSVGKRLGCHIVGVAAEGCAAPRRVRRMRTRCAPTPKLGKPQVQQRAL